MNKHVLSAGVLTLAMVLCSSEVLARDTVIQIAPSIGMGRLHIAADQALSHQSEDADTLALGVTVGVVTPIGLLFEVGGFNYSNFSFLGAAERINLGEGTFAVGYQFESANGFRAVPKVGRMKWRLSDKEGQLFNPGPEAQNIGAGYANFWALSLQKHIAKWVSLGVDLKAESLDVARARAIMFVATFDM